MFDKLKAALDAFNRFTAGYKTYTGALVAALSGAFAMAHLNVDASAVVSDVQGLLAAVGVVLGFVLTIYGRFVTKA